jgi:hypothetical protein
MRKKSLLNGLAGAAALAGASQAYGTVIVRPTPANIVGHDPASTTSSATTTRNIDVDGNGTNDLQIRYRSFTSGAYQLQQMFVFSNTGQTAAYGPVGTGTAAQYYAYDLQVGDVIPGSNAFGQSASFLTQVVTNVNGSDYAIWMTGERAFIGFSFMNPATSMLNYGFVECELDAFGSSVNPTGGIRFFGLAYENSGGSITAFQVPEPSTLAALAFGAIGLGAAALRRKKS